MRSQIGQPFEYDGKTYVMRKPTTREILKQGQQDVQNGVKEEEFIASSMAPYLYCNPGDGNFQNLSVEELLEADFDVFVHFQNIFEEYQEKMQPRLKTTNALQTVLRLGKIPPDTKQWLERKLDDYTPESTKGSEIPKALENASTVSETS